MKKLLQKLFPHSHPLRLLWHNCKAFVAALRYGFPARSLIVIGVTGTDGKTTTVAMIAHILEQVNIRCAALSTAYFKMNGKIQWNATQKTSPSPFVIQRFLRQACKEKCTHVILECSSHGLVQGRLRYTWPRIATVTNLSEEHLDYHKTMQAYRNAKGLLLRILRKNGTRVLNADDATYPYYKSIGTTREITCSSRSTSVNQAHENVLFLTDLIASSTELRARVRRGSEEGELYIPMAGSFNATNALLAIGCTLAAGIPLSHALSAFRSFHGVPGRMERIDAGQPFSVFVDFTVTPQSYDATLRTLKKSLVPGARLLVLAGSCGDRMKEKRPIVGGLCASYADIVVLTNEDPYTENPLDIIDDIARGLPKDLPYYRDARSIPSPQPNRYAVRILDRLEAIRWILRTAHAEDIVLLAGKGSDTTMWEASGRIPWNEREIAKTELQSLRVPSTNRIEHDA